jgi:2-iminobutanoate/2-iminopropanoate deaminase
VTRRSIHLPGVTHKAPIPTAAVVGNLLMSSAIGGKDPETGEQPPDAATQVRNAFATMRRLVEGAGGTTADIVKVTVFLRDRADRTYVDEEWLAMFPDPEDRPARHAVALEREGKALVQLEIVAVIGGGGGGV